MKKAISTILAAAVVAMVHTAGWSAVSADEAAKLGSVLTPVGAEKGPNADGTIPAWDGGLKKTAVKNQEYPDPFAADQPILTITADNADTYKDRLTEGQKAMLKKYSGYKLVVYPTRRSASFPPNVYDALKQNAAKASLAEGGNGVLNTIITSPFPIPKNGLEAIWNHMLHFRAEKIVRETHQVPVTAGGNFTVNRLVESLLIVYATPGLKTGNEKNLIFYFMQNYFAPPRFAGLITMVHEPINQVIEPRHAWIYAPGLRRVRRTAELSYDSPAPSADGLRTMDQYDMYNGSPDRYDWTLVGKKEMYVPYNSYRLYAEMGDHKKVLKPQFVNPDVLRYELHRVWVVDAVLKKGKANIFGRRTFYIDEDSWQILTVDQYDNRGAIWRVSDAHTINFYDNPSIWSVADVYTDLASRRYNFESHPRYDFNAKITADLFSPAGVRKTGVR